MHVESNHAIESNAIKSGLGNNMRIRLEYEKDGALRYSSTLDLQKIWERSFRRAKIEMTYSQGFHPHPKMQIALPLPLGFISQVEIIDIWIEKNLNSNTIKEQITAALPNGLRIKSIQIIEDAKKSLVNQIKSVSYKIIFNNSLPNPDNLREKIDQFLKKDAIPRIRRNKPYDLRPLVNSLILTSDKTIGNHILLILTAESGKTGRPDEVVDELGLDILNCMIIRTSIEIPEKKGE